MTFIPEPADAYYVYGPADFRPASAEALLPHLTGGRCLPVLPTQGHTRPVGQHVEPLVTVSCVAVTTDFCLATGFRRPATVTAAAKGPEAVRALLSVTCAASGVAESSTEVKQPVRSVPTTAKVI